MSTAQSLAIIELEPQPPAQAVIIWLHGLGASNQDFVPVATELQQLVALSLRFVFPQAPSQPVTINNGYIMPAWYDITSLGKEGDIDHLGIQRSVTAINQLIEHELQRGFASKNIFLAGFSQGAVIVLSTLLSYPQPLGGIIALSGYLPLAAPPAKFLTPIFLAHGIEDTVVPYIYAEAAAENLQKAHYPVDWHRYAMAHSVCGQEVHDLAQWLFNIYRQ